MTAIADPPAAPEVPADAPLALTAPRVPVATLTADLMPDEIVVKRRLGYLKRRLVFVMVALVALVVLGDLLVGQQTHSAQDELSAANANIATLNGRLDHFNGMLTTQSETQAIWTQLDAVMGTDVSWPALLGKLKSPAPAGVHLTSITAQTADPSAAAGAASSVTAAVPDAAGTITLIGNAPNWTAVARYVRGLSAVNGFTAVNPSTVSNGSAGPGTSGGASLTFTVTLDLTSAALSNRYTPTPAAPAPGAPMSSTPASGAPVSGAPVSGAPATPADGQTPGRSSTARKRAAHHPKTRHPATTRHPAKARHHATANGSHGGSQSTQEAS